MAEVSHPGTVDIERRSQIIVCRKRVELCGGVGWSPSERHVAPIFSQHDSVSGAALYGPGPFQLPHCQIGVSVKTEKDAGRSLRIADDKTREGLAVGSAIGRTACLDGIFVKTWGLEEDAFLGLPKQSQQAEEQRECNEGGNHMRTLRGFQ